MRCSHVNCYSLRKKQERTTTTTKNMLEINKHKGFINGIIVIIKCKTSKPKKIVVCICGQYKKEHGFTDAPFFNCKMSLIFVISDQINYRHGTKSTLFLLHPNWDGFFLHCYFLLRWDFFINVDELNLILLKLNLQQSRFVFSSSFLNHNSYFFCWTFILCECVFLPFCFVLFELIVFGCVQLTYQIKLKCFHHTNQIKNNNNSMIIDGLNRNGYSESFV